MGAVKFSQRGDFSRLDNYLEKAKKAAKMDTILDKYGKLGVEALSSATPVRTGTTAASWYYKIVCQNGIYELSFFNSNSNEGVPIALVIQYGHGTPTGGWVEGIDYINPAIKPLFEELANKAWKEVTNA